MQQQLKASCLRWCVMMVAVVGCDAPASPRDERSAASVPESVSSVFDAGVVLANRPGYLCLAFDQVGLNADDQVVSLESSCDCVEPRLVQYYSDANTSAPAIMLEYIDESASSSRESEARDFKSRPANLGVIIKVGLSDGSSHDFTVNVLHTTLAEEGQS